MAVPASEMSYPCAPSNENVDVHIEVHRHDVLLYCSDTFTHQVFCTALRTTKHVWRLLSSNDTNLCTRPGVSRKRRNQDIQTVADSLSPPTLMISIDNILQVPRNYMHLLRWFRLVLQKQHPYTTPLCSSEERTSTDDQGTYTYLAYTLRASPTSASTLILDDGSSDFMDCCEDDDGGGAAPMYGAPGLDHSPTLGSMGPLFKRICLRS